MVKLKVIEAQFELIYEKKKSRGVAVALLVCVAKPGGRDRAGGGWGGECECSEDPLIPSVCWIPPILL